MGLAKATGLDPKRMRAKFVYRDLGDSGELSMKDMEQVCACVLHSNAIGFSLTRMSGPQGALSVIMRPAMLRLAIHISHRSA